MIEVVPGSEALARYKQEAAEYAVKFIQSGMTVGLGTGSTAIYATRRIAELYRIGQLRDIVAVATSRIVWQEAVKLGIPMLNEDLPQEIDVTIDGADEVDPGLNLIKGGGGALLREKIVAQASRREIIVMVKAGVDASLCPSNYIQHLVREKCHSPSPRRSSFMIVSTEPSPYIAVTTRTGKTLQCPSGGR